MFCPFLTGVLVVLVASLPAQTLTYVHDGSSLGFSEGWALALAGDVNGDQIPDLITGCPDPFLGPGSVRILSLAGGSLIRVHAGEATGHQLGTSVDGGFDADQDGVPDVLGGAPGFDQGNPFDNRGRVYAWSGATGTLLYSATGSGPFESFGTAVTWLGDLDNDGRSEFAVGAPGWSGLLGRVTVHRGGDGTVMLALNGESAADRFGSAVARAGDLNGDGIPDLLAGAPYRATNNGAGRVYLYAMPAGALLRIFDGTQAAEHLGLSVCSVPDLNQDGIRDVVAGAPDYDPPGLIDSGRARAYSGATGALLWEFAGTLLHLKAGIDVDGVSDLDGDQVGDVLVGLPYIPP